MTKKIPVWTALILMALTAVVSFQLTFIAVNNKYEEKFREFTAAAASTAGEVAPPEGGPSVSVGLDESGSTVVLEAPGSSGWALAAGDIIAAVDGVPVPSGELASLEGASELTVLRPDGEITLYME